MNKSFFIAAIAVLTFVGCTNKKTSDTKTLDPISTVNQDSVDTAHGHSHNPSSSQAKDVEQDSIDKEHGHQH